MGKIIIPDAVKRKDGYIYYIDGEGSILESPRAKGRTKNSKGKRKPAVKKMSKIIAKKLIAKKAKGKVVSKKKVAKKTVAKAVKKVVKAKKK